jgi:hypothetical protein
MVSTIQSNEDEIREELDADQHRLLSEVRVAYADAAQQVGDDRLDHGQRCLSFLTSGWFEDGDALAYALEAIGQYNRFEADKVAEHTRKISEQCGYVRVAVGREGSPVLYIETDDPATVKDVLAAYADECWEVNHDEVGNARKLAGDDYIDAHNACRHDEPPVAAEDYAEPGDGRRVVRCWWD